MLAKPPLSLSFSLSCSLSLSFSFFFDRTESPIDRGRELVLTFEQTVRIRICYCRSKNMTCAVLTAQRDAKTGGLGRPSTIQYSPTGSSCIHRCATCTTDLPTGIF